MARKHKSAWDKILDFLKKHKKLAYNSKEIANAIKLPPVQVRVVARQMFNRGALDSRLYKSNNKFGKREIMYFMYKSFKMKLDEETNIRIDEIADFLMYLGSHPNLIRSILRPQDLQERRRLQAMMRQYHKKGVTRPRRRRR